MQQPINPSFPVTLCLDLGVKSTQCAIYRTDGKGVDERRVATGRERFTELLERFPDARVVMEASTSTRWINNLAKGMGYDVVIANPRNIPQITASV